MVTEFKRYAVFDGPGIRTTVFIKGCPLRCKWCSNPETHKIHQQLYFIPRRCKQNGICVNECPEGAVSMDLNNKINRLKCNLCMKCTEVCLNNAFQKVGEEYTVDEVIREIEKDLPFYGKEGGVTISGGEPFFQPEFTLNILKMCKEKNINTVLDTTAYVKKEIIQESLKYTDLFLLDIKHMDSKKHKEGTGVGNELILDNIELITKSCNVRISLPLIPGYNDDYENIFQTASYVSRLGINWVDINPLNTIGTAKYNYLGMDSPFEGMQLLKKEKIQEVVNIFNEKGIRTTVGRMM